jgi:hypothetical protein
VTVALSSTSLPVHGSAFNVSHETYDYCELIRDELGVYFSNQSSLGTCKAYATVSLPANTTITAVRCYAKHDDSTDDTVIKLYERYSHKPDMMTSASMVEHTVATLTFDSPASSLASEYETATLASKNIFFDGPSSYVLEYDPSNPAGASTDERLYQCHIYYDH